MEYVGGIAWKHPPRPCSLHRSCANHAEHERIVALQDATRRADRDDLRSREYVGEISPTPHLLIGDAERFGQQVLTVRTQYRLPTHQRGSQAAPRTSPSVAATWRLAPPQGRKSLLALGVPNSTASSFLPRQVQRTGKILSQARFCKIVSRHGWFPQTYLAVSRPIAASHLVRSKYPPSSRTRSSSCRTMSVARNGKHALGDGRVEALPCSPTIS